MKKYAKIMTCIALCVLTLVILSACQKTVTNSSDELTLYSWHTKQDNSNEVLLEFEGDCATMKITLYDSQPVVISGLCEISDDMFVIYDSTTKVSYAFSYIVHFDRVEIVYKENTVSLYKM